MRRFWIAFSIRIAVWPERPNPACAQVHRCVAPSASARHPRALDDAVFRYSAGNTTSLTALAEVLNIDGSVQWKKSADLDSAEDSVATCIHMEYPAGLSAVHFVRLTLSRAGGPVTTNLYMEAGQASPDSLISDIKSGFYVTDLMGMGVNGVTGDYSRGASGFWIENGKITYPVAEVTIAGNLKDMFLNLTPADDLVFRYATNAPTIRVEGMTVAGA